MIERYDLLSAWDYLAIFMVFMVAGMAWHDMVWCMHVRTTWQSLWCLWWLFGPTTCYTVPCRAMACMSYHVLQSIVVHACVAEYDDVILD